MQTLLAFARAGHHETRAPAPDALPGVARVERHYAALAGAALKHEFAGSGGLGLHVWEAHAQHRRWPAWQQRGDLAVATLHTPVDYERVAGDIPPELAPIPLARTLRARPAAVLELAAPWVLAALDAHELVLFTDALGVGRLFELRLPGLQVWTNRPTAAFLFAGLPVTPDVEGWGYHAGTDWFMADSTPFEGLAIVRPGTCLRVGGGGERRESSVEPVRHWLAAGESPREEGRLDPDTLDRVAEALQGTARSVSRLWTSTPKLGLSGGRDSRVVAAAFLAAGVGVDLHTNANPPGEAEVASELLARWGGDVAHEVRQIASIGAPVQHAKGGADRALGWMRHAEGLQPASYLPRMPPSSHAGAAHLMLSGAGGEVAHGHYYPADIAAVQALPASQQLGACAAHLRRRLLPKRGPNQRSRALVGARIDEVIGTAVGDGAQPLVALDVFYLLERLRRWSSAGHQADLVVPLLTPEFVAAALSMTPQQRTDNDLHRGLVQRLVPAWSDVPFFGAQQAPPPAQPAARTPRLWEVDRQRDVLAGILHDTSAWADAFDVRQVHEIWHKAVVGGASAAEESVLQRVLWRAAFAEYADEVNARPSRRPAAISPANVGKVQGVPAPRAGTARLKGRLRRKPVVRRVAATPLGRRLRRLLT